MELHAVKMFYTEREGLVELEDDVLSILRQVKELYGNKIRVCMEPTSGEYVFSENCEDGTERLIFTTTELDGRALDRLLRSDSQLRGYTDIYEQQEKDQDRIMAEKDQASREKIGAVGEEIAHALKREGRAPRLPLTVGFYTGKNRG